MTDKELLFVVCNRLLLASEYLGASAIRQDLRESADKIATFCEGLETILTEVRNKFLESQNALEVQERERCLQGIGGGHPYGFDPDQEAE